MWGWNLSVLNCFLGFNNWLQLLLKPHETANYLGENYAKRIRLILPTKFTAGISSSSSYISVLHFLLVLHPNSLVEMDEQVNIFIINVTMHNTIFIDRKPSESTTQTIHTYVHDDTNRVIFLHPNHCATLVQYLRFSLVLLPSPCWQVAQVQLFIWRG